MSKTKKTWRVTVEFVTDDVRGEVSSKDAKEYAQEAVEAWHGQYSPDDPRMGNIDKVRVVEVLQVHK